MIKMAHFSPLPPQPSGIADYCAALLPHLAERVQVDVYSDAPGIHSASNVRPIQVFLDSPDLWCAYDACLYHMGNHPAYHEQIYATLTRHPGITVLHELDLQAFHLHRPRPVHACAAYVREMGYANGVEGAREARLICAGLRDVPDAPCPSFQRIADVSLGLIVHTEYARQIVLTKSPHARVAYIPHAVHVTEPVSIDKPLLLRQFPSDTLVLASFGFIAPSKRIESVLRALARLRGEWPNLHYVLVGELAPGYDLMPFIRDLGLANVVHLTGYVDEAEFRGCLAAVDIGINLRTGPSGGEMSGALLRLLANGRSVLVSDVGGFAEFPDNCVIKIRQDETEVEQLVMALRRLMTDPAARVAYGQAGRRYVQQEFSFPRVVEQIADFVCECIEQASRC
jgi:glycosyltransferase involved in cell wall biosynthesis